MEASDNADLEALEKFLLENPELAALERRIAGFNIFEAFGNVRREERHSDFLAYLLGPTHPHGLGAVVLRAFMIAAVRRQPKQPSPVRPIDIALYDLTDARVEREWNRIDVLVVSEADKVVLLIENKVDTDEHSNQLTRYLERATSRFPGHRVLPVFLTRDGHAASHPKWHALAHSDVHAILVDLLSRPSAALSRDVEVALRHYAELLERHLMEDTPIARLARRIYERHARALDLIFEHRPDEQTSIRDALVAHVDAADDLRTLHVSKKEVQFVPSAWRKVEVLATSGDGSWASATDLVRFCFKGNTPGTGMTLHVILGPGDPALRERIHAAVGQASRQALFGRRRTKLTPVWTQIARQTVFTAKEDARASLDEKLRKIDAFWRTSAEWRGRITEAIAGLFPLE